MRNTFCTENFCTAWRQSSWSSKGNLEISSLKDLSSHVLFDQDNNDTRSIWNQMVLKLTHS